MEHPEIIQASVGMGDGSLFSNDQKHTLKLGIGYGTNKRADLLETNTLREPQTLMFRCKHSHMMAKGNITNQLHASSSGYHKHLGLTIEICQHLLPTYLPRN